MRAEAECIVLSSSPDRDAIGIPTLPVEMRKETTHQDGLLSPSPPLSATLPPPTRSRFFSTPPYSRSKTMNTAAESANNDEQTVKKTTKVRKSKSGLQGELLELDKPKKNAPTKPKQTKKRQEKAGPGEEKLKNKTITGKVSKSGTRKPKTSAPNADDDKKTTRERSTGKKDTDNQEEDDLHLEPAMKRRLDWTPTKERSQRGAALEDQEVSDEGRDSLGTLISAYGYNKTTAAPDGAQLRTDMGPTKRRRIELVDPRVLPVKPLSLVDNSLEKGESEADESAVSKPIKKTKTRTKRLTTLTARVTASYREVLTESSDLADQGLFAAAGSSPGAIPKSRRTRKTVNETSGFKVPRTIVISPEDAVKSLDEQDLIFGTCSQLERADSPTLLRDTQTALQESEKESCASSSRLNEFPETSRSSSGISRLATQKNLWSVAARDAEGSLVNVEVVDLVDSPEVPKVTAQPFGNDREKCNRRSSVEKTGGLSAVSTAKSSALSDAPPVNEELPVSTGHTVEQPASGKLKSKPKSQMPHYKGMTDLQMAKEIQGYGLKPIKNRGKMIDTLEKCWIAKHGPTASEEAQKSQTKETGEATSSAPELQKAEVEQKKPSAASQRKVKAQPRSQPIPESTKEDSGTTVTITRIADRIKQPVMQLPTQRDSQPPSKRTFIDVEEIQDSEDDELPSPSRILDQFLGTPPRRDEKNKKRNQELPTSPVPSISRSPFRRTQAKTTTLGSKPSLNLPDLGAQITKAVRAQPQQGSLSQSPASRRKKPSWHEKILLYDPIYLEDFTAWLNTEGLDLVDEDREVNAGFVRQWCESKGICCCYRVKKAGRY
ncbi:hypothetical protein BDV18DRAFT_133546 [Aspergillus unguis]